MERYKGDKTGEDITLSDDTENTGSQNSMAESSEENVRTRKHLSAGARPKEYCSPQQVKAGQIKKGLDKYSFKKLRNPYFSESDKQPKTREQKQSLPYNMRYIDKNYLEELIQSPPEYVAKEFLRKLDEFVKIMKMCQNDDSLIPVMFYVLAKVSTMNAYFISISNALRDSNFIESVAVPYLLSLLGSACHHVNIVQCTLIIIKFIADNSCNSIVSFYSILAVLSDLIKEIRMSDLCSAAEQADFEEFDYIKSRIHSIRRKQEKKKRNKEDELLPPEDFRSISVSPTAEDVVTTRIPFVRKNKSFGSYNSLEHYLDVQFRLLREDFVAPLRESIQELKRQQQAKNETFKDIRVYRNVEIAGTTCSTTNEGICHILTFDTSGTAHVGWEHSKRLKFGSLLCLSYDTFETIYFATVTNSQVADLELGIVECQFTCGMEIVRQIAGNVFTMVESESYFEAYKHNLKALKQIKELPFSEHIVDCEEHVEAPAYLIQDEHITYDLNLLAVENMVFRISDEGAVLTDDKASKKPKESRKTSSATNNPKLKNIEVLRDSTWPCKTAVRLDDSQYRALRNALQHRFSITQGPPGTGKTYVGLKIAKALLANKFVWSSAVQKQPMLVVCYTNHALDQFLCGIADFYKGEIVRIGGRSSSETMKQCSIKRFYKDISDEVKATESHLRTIAKQIQDRIISLKQHIYLSSRQIVQIDDLKRYMGEFQKQLVEDFLSKLERENQHSDDKKTVDQFNIIREWLGCGCFLNRSDVQVQFQKTDIPVNLVSEMIAENNAKLTQDYVSEVNNNSSDSYYEHSGCFSKADIIQVRQTVKENSQDIKSGIKKDNNCIYYDDISPMSEESQNCIDIVWNLEFRQRWELYKSWVEQMKGDLIETLKEYEEMFEQNCQEIKEADQKKQIEALHKADVIGLTTTGAARYYEVLINVKPKIVIVEEAAEVLEAHIVTSLSDQCEHLVLIGDHKQLRPSPAVYELAKRFRLDISLFERMINNKVNYECLEYQHRMRPEISQLIRLFYPNLKNHDSVANKQNIKGVSSNVYFVSHRHPESKDEDNTSHSNRHEATFIVELCRYLLKQQYSPSEITILTTYSAQMFLLRRLMAQEEFVGVSITVVDNYQGEENEIVLLSLVRSNIENNIGFLKTENRINVALSRARNGLFVIGNFASFEKVSDIWASIVSLLRKENHIGPSLPLFCRNHTDTKLAAKAAEDFQNTPEGGCNEDCDTRLDCGHVCRLKCHVYDTDHKQYKCQVPCKRMCKNNHKCSKRCFEECGNCEVEMTKRMPNCGHVQTVPCYIDTTVWECKAPCNKMCKNNHQCSKRCFEECGNCEVEMTKRMPNCGHVQTVRCYIDTTVWECKAPCNKMCKNNHQCNKMCFETCGICKAEMTKIMPKCRHAQTLPCYLLPELWKCKAPCNRECENSHACPKLCFEKCGNCKVKITKTKPNCGHSQIMPCFVDPATWKCQALCGEILECGHKCQAKCSDTKHQCHVIVNTKFDKCGHFVEKECFRLSKDVQCNMPCEYELECGHKCSRKCYEPHSPVCKKIVFKDLKCGHSLPTMCYKNEEDIKCTSPCKFILQCGHTCVNKCYRPHNKICSKISEKTLHCGRHKLYVPCSFDITKKQCHFPCLELLACGHKCTNKCSRPHTDFCKVVVTKTLSCGHTCEVFCGTKVGNIKCSFPCHTELECGHKCKNKCWEPHTDFCKVVVKKTLPCKHTLKVFCGTNKANLKCSFPCLTELECGHNCKNKCCEPHIDNCLMNVTFECNHGHTTIMPCYKVYNRTEIECSAKCRQLLKCGHTCCGSCFECSGGTLHKACSVCVLPENKHRWQSNFSREGIPCIAKCQNRCSHVRCDKLCFEPCADDGTTDWPCEKQCYWECLHFYCSKLYLEDCNHPVCIESCIKKLKTGVTENQNRLESHGDETCGTYEPLCSVVLSLKLNGQYEAFHYCPVSDSNEGPTCILPLCAKSDEKVLEIEIIEIPTIHQKEITNLPTDNGLDKEKLSSVVLLLNSDGQYKTFHKSCSASLDVSILEAILFKNDGIASPSCPQCTRKINVVADIAGTNAKKLHKIREEKKLKSEFYLRHREIESLLAESHAKLSGMNPGGDLHKICKWRLEKRQANVRDFLHFQEQGYIDLKTEFGRLLRMANSILTYDKMIEGAKVIQTNKDEQVDRDKGDKNEEREKLGGQEYRRIDKHTVNVDIQRESGTEIYKQTERHIKTERKIQREINTGTPRQAKTKTDGRIEKQTGIQEEKQIVRNKEKERETIRQKTENKQKEMQNSQKRDRRIDKKKSSKNESDTEKQKKLGRQDRKRNKLTVRHSERQPDTRSKRNEKIEIQLEDTQEDKNKREGENRILST